MVQIAWYETTTNKIAVILTYDFKNKVVYGVIVDPKTSNVNILKSDTLKIKQL
jgi:hypothetical protein